MIRQKLRFSLLIPIVAGTFLALIFGFLLFNVSQFGSTIVQNSVSENGRSMLAVSSRLAFNPLYQLDVSALNEILEHFHEQPTIAYAAVRDVDGNIVAQTEETELIADEIEIALSSSALRTGETVERQVEPLVVLVSPIGVADTRIGTMEIVIDQTLLLEGARTELQTLILTASGLLLFTLTVILLVAGLLIFNPLRRLTEAAEKIKGGDLVHSVSISGLAEFRLLGSTLEEMRQNILSAYNDLEYRVKATSASFELGRRLSTILDEAELATAVVELLQITFKYYHAHIYLYDKKGEYLVVAGGTGAAGQAMLANNHKIEPGKGLVGRTAQTNKSTLVPDVTADPNWLPNPLLPETKAEVAVPITLEDEVLGVIDIQHNVAGGLNEADVTLLTSIANQVAIGLQNARQYQQLQESEARTRAVLDAVNIPVTITKISDGSFMYFNKPSLEAVGLDPNNPKAMNMKVNDFYDKDSPGRQEYVASMRESGKVDNLEMTLKRINGETFKVLMSSRVIDFQDERGVITSYIDITEHHKTREASVKRAREMETVAELGTVSGTILDPDRLLQELVDLIKSRFALYHAHIHLLNDARDTMILAAGAGEIGQKMVAEGRRIPLAAEASLVATVARTRQGAIRNYDPPGEGFMPHPLLSNTSCEMAVPIAIGEEVLGVLDVRSEQLNHFTQDDMQTYTIMAGQIAVALQNARTYKKSEEAIQELRELSRRLTREGWDELFKQQYDELAYRYDLEEVRSITAGANAAIEPEVEAMLVQPLQVQGEFIGELALGSGKLSKDEASEIVTAVAERLGVHLENLRLAWQTQNALNETQRRTEELAILNEMSQSLTAQTSVDGVFQTVYEYLSRLMDTTDFFTVLYDEERDEVEFVLTASEEELRWYTEKRQAGHGVTEYIIRHQQPLLLSENVGEQLEKLGIAGYGKMPESWLGAPITLGERVLGVIGLQSYTIPRLYNEQHLNLLRAVANQAAIAIESTRLLEGTVALAEEEQILRQITTRVSTAIDAESILRTAAEEIGRALGLEGYVSLEGVGSNGTNGHEPVAETNGKVKNVG